MALGARFSGSKTFSDVDRRRRGDQFAARARTLLDLTDISVQTIQSCILLGTISYSHSQTQSEALYYSVAIRLALILDLPQRVCEKEIERQVNLRIWASLHMIDIWSSIGLNLPRQLGFKECYPLPTDEETFLSLRDSTALPANNLQRGLWAEMVVLSQIWAQIHELNKRSVSKDMESVILSREVDDLAQQLYGWAAALPLTLQETPENLQRYTRLGLGNAFAALHLGYHYYFEVLFYQFLARTSSSHQENTFTRAHRAQCEKHALEFCDLLYRCRAMDKCQCLYVMVGHMLVVTSTVYIHILLFSDCSKQVSLARQRLARNFEILTELQSFWLTLDVALSRLQIFHNACNRSIDETFRMDQWMLTFILEHGSSVAERFLPEPGNSSDTLQAWYTQEFI
ncbi:hypothetical protein BDV59DRAFT_210654 [Aspergillus ambiguus]|uniref:fungal specific transcription factor domain-containing protein n=1 Tax=Aspergillus ambiguus TaxID=176160 RepID=UPI003CCDA084